MFTAYQNTKYNVEFQRAYARTGINDHLREEQRKSDERIRKINEETNDIYRQIADNTSRTFQESNERWSDAFLDRERYVVLKKVY
jgi:shikimate kinase